MFVPRLTAEQVVRRAESLSERFDVFGGAEPAGDRIIEETVVFTHRLKEEEQRSALTLTETLYLSTLEIPNLGRSQRAHAIRRF